jgi:N-terminal domain of reverse transcriptase
VRHTAIAPMSPWNTMGWVKSARQVLTRQNRRYRAAKRGDQRPVRRLQTLWLRSRAANLFAVRPVTPDHPGQQPPGGDGVAQLMPPARLDLVHHRHLGGHASPVRRVDMPKPGTTEPRPVGMPMCRADGPSVQGTGASRVEAGPRGYPRQETTGPSRRRGSRPPSSDRLAPRGTHLRREGEPGRMVRGRLDVRQPARGTPVRQRAASDMAPVGGRPCRRPPLAPGALRVGPRAFGATARQRGRPAHPRDFRRGARPAHASGVPGRVEPRGPGASWRAGGQCAAAVDHGGVGTARSP